MDFNNLKDTFTHLCNNINNTIIDSPVFHFIKEKYDNLNSFYRKALYVISVFILACILLYYPASHLYSSWRNMRSFKTKKQLTQDLIDLSISTQTSASQAYTSNRDPVQFINQKIITLRIPKNQIKSVKKSEITPPQKSTTFSMPTTIQTVEVAMENLNLKEVIEYGHQLEQLSKNIKLTSLHIIENPKQDNYFNVSYILSFLNLKQEALPENKTTQKKALPTNTENNKIFDTLKVKKGFSPPPEPPNENLMDKNPIPITDLKKIDSSKSLLDLKKKEQDVPLLDLKKEDIPDGSAHFENRPKKVKERDLLPKPPTPKDMQDKSSLSDLPPPPPPPSFNDLPNPDRNDTTKKKE